MAKKLIAIFMVIIMLLEFTSCSKTEDKVSNDNTITMYLWDVSMTRELTPWLEEKFPEINFEFIVGYNNIDFYNYLQERGELPDIITNRRFSLYDAASLKNQLMDMSRTELVGTFYTTYIENNRDIDGSIKWLPMCAEIDGIIANKDVFKEYNVPIPNNYSEFVEACRIFEENGIGGFNNDYEQDYSCLEAMQGCAIPELMSLEGTTWRTKYESNLNDKSIGLDNQVWPTVFKKFEQFLKDTYVKPSDINRSFNEIKELFLDNKLAMVRGTSTDCLVLNSEYGINAIMLPYYGETQEDNWLLTYPFFQVSVNKNVEQNETKKENVLKILDTMFSSEGQKKASVNSSFLTYNSTINIELDENLSSIKIYAENNHLYQRLASTEFFSISKDVTHKMITGEYDAQSAYNAFNQQLITPNETDDDKIVATIDTKYDYTFTNYGSQAVSSVVNTLRKDMNTDILIGYSSLITSSIFAGDYTEQQLKWLANNRASIKTANLTGTQIRKVMEWLINTKEDGSNPIVHFNQIPATSGMEYSMKLCDDGTYILENITINGNEIDDNATYSVTLVGNDNSIESQYFRNCPMPEDIKALLINIDDNASIRLTYILSNGGKLENPNRYVTIN